MQQFQLVDVDSRQQIVPHREYLPKLEEDQPQFFKGFPHLHRCRPMPPAEQGPEDLVAGEHTQDLEQPRQRSQRAALVSFDRFSHGSISMLANRGADQRRPASIRDDQLELEVLECRRGSKASSLQHAALPCVTIPAATTTISPSAKGCHARSSSGTLAIKVTACMPGSPATP